jgi:TIR domain
MPIEVTCLCGQRFRVEEAHANQEVPCPGCQKPVRILGPTVTPFDVFISYSSKDKAVADAAVATLEARGIRCWVAPRDIVPGKEWSESIIEGINQCRVLVLIFSASSNSSQQVVREVERAVHRGVPIVPFRIEDLLPSKAMEYFISSRHWLDAYHPPLDDHLDRLATTCNALLTGTAGPRQDTKDDRKGLLRSAVRSLLARDHRTRLLVALTLACLFIGCLVVGAMYLMRDPKASPEVIEARVAAESAWAEARKATAGLGVDGEVQAIENMLKTAQSHFDQKQFDLAKTTFADVTRRAAEVQALGDMKKSRAAFEEGSQRIDSTGLRSDGTGSWKESERLAHEAEKQKQYGEAKRLYQEAQARFEKQALPQLHYLCFWAGYAPRVITFARLGEAANERLRKMGAFVLRGAPFSSREDSAQAWRIFETECVPQLRIDSALSGLITQEKDPEKIHHAADRMGGLLEKKFGKDAQKWYALGFHVASVTGFLEHHVHIGTEISPYGYLRYRDYSREPLRAMLDNAFLAQRTELPRQARDSLVEAAFLYAHTVETEVSFGYAGARRQFRPCLERYRRFASTYLMESRQAVEFLSKSPLLPMKFNDEQWGNIREHWNKGVNTLIFLNDRGEQVSWVHAPIAKQGTDLVNYITALPPLYRLDLGSGEKGTNPQTAEAVADQLSKFTTLRELSLHGVPVAETRMAQIGKLSGLRVLTLWHIKPERPELLKPLNQLQELRWFSLYDKAIGADALVHLAGLKNLEELYLGGTKITAQGLAHLKGLTHLKVFVTSGVDRKALDAFRAEMPNLSPKKPGK